MAYEDVGKLPAVQQQQQRQQAYDPGYGYYDPYPIPNDPYRTNPIISMNEKMMLAILDSKIRDEKDFDEIRPMLMIIIDNVARIPNIEMTVVKSLQRDMADILALSQCQGTKRKVLSRMTQMIFEIRSLVPYGGAALVGLTGVSAIITTRQQQDQRITYPQQPAEPPRKKVFGLF